MGADLTLPDFESPPLEEVVVGVQFAAPPGYSILHASEVWTLFKSDYPDVTEQSRLEPQFEIFGGNPQAGFQMNFASPPTRGRLWFSSSDNTHLVQFQEDRFILNWRRQGANSSYPRYEKILENFSRYLSELNKFVEGKYSTSLVINQAEVSYINIIQVPDFSEAGSWIKFFGSPELNLESLNAILTEIINSDVGKPVARMSYEIQSVWTPDMMQKAIRLSLTCRGKPNKENLDSALDFIAMAREKIVRRFCELTTDDAQKKWGRRQ
jgi:uncharacterized protein (TIGR04255 family)